MTEASFEVMTRERTRIIKEDLGVAIDRGMESTLRRAIKLYKIIRQSEICWLAGSVQSKTRISRRTVVVLF